jgi:hypothetical protein
MFQDESLAGQLAGLVVVGDADPRPGDPLIRDRRFESPIGRAHEARPSHESNRELVGVRRRDADEHKSGQEDEFHLIDGDWNAMLVWLRTPVSLKTWMAGTIGE